MTFRADLHCHSTCSDGSMSPIELINEAKRVELSAISITDHDSISAYTQETFDYAQKVNLDLITGVEFSTVIDGISVHFLGYNFCIKSPEIEDLCKRHKDRRTKRYQAILELLKQKKMPVSEEELLNAVFKSSTQKQNTVIGRPHIAQMMVKLGYVKDLKEAFKKYLGDGCSCFVQGEYVTPEETIDAIHKAGGVAIIAHPHLIKYPSVLKKVLAMNFDGIECYYSKFPPQDHIPWLEIAKERNWLITGGSDFHGDVKPMIPLGCSWIDAENYNKLKQKKPS